MWCGLGDVGLNEEIVYCDFSDKFVVEVMVEGCDGIVYMGGWVVEGVWEIVKVVNIDGMFNFYEGV